jgi:superfamily II DNA or RNA helicase
MPACLPDPLDPNHDVQAIEREIERLEQRLLDLRAELDEARSARSITKTRPSPGRSTTMPPSGKARDRPFAAVDKRSQPHDKIALFRSLFVGRGDVFATRWVSARTGKSGWSPAVRGGYYNDAASDADLLPLTDRVIDRHLRGVDEDGRDVHVGIYPMLTDDSCRLLVCDFDGRDWRADAAAYAAACRDRGVMAATEVSRSGDGAHVWFFFDEAVPAQRARSFAMHLLRAAMDARGTMSLSSYDRFFPAQDLLPRQSPGRLRLGNLIALPLQGTCRRQGTTVFVDPETWLPFDDQFAFLAGIEPVTLMRAAGSPEAYPPVRHGPIAPGTPERRPRSPIAPAAATKDERPQHSVTIDLDSMIQIATDGLPGWVIAELKHKASLPNPEFYRRQAQRFSTFGTPRLVTCFHHDQARLALPRGLLDSVKQIMSAARIRVTLVDRFPQRKRIAVKFRGALSEKQEQAVASLLPHDLGVLVAPPGSGKTVMACRMIAERAVPTAIIVNRAELASQWRERLCQFLDVPADRIGQLGGGKRKRRGIIDIIVLQSVARRTADPTLLDEYGLIVADECHALGAPAAEAAMRQVAVRQWLGLTATPYRADHMDAIITMQCGPIRHVMDRAVSQSRELIVHDTAFETSEPGTDGPSIQAIYNEIASDANRNRQICRDVALAHEAGRNCLVLSNRVDHVERLVDQLNAAGVRALVLHGRLQPAERRAVRADLARLDAKAPLTLVAIDRVAGEGLDLPRLDTLFLAVPISFRGRVVQNLGRVTRTSRQTPTAAHVHDYRDVRVPLLERMFRKRHRVMLKQGFTVADEAAPRTSHPGTESDARDVPDSRASESTM